MNPVILLSVLARQTFGLLALEVRESVTTCEADILGVWSPRLLRGQASRIIGGTEAPPNGYPHQVSLQVLYDASWFHFCGGSIVGSDKVITAAHCLYYSTKYTVRVVAGEHDFRNCSGLEQFRSVKSAKIHPNYTADSLDYDYGVLLVTEPFVLNSVVSILPLARQEPRYGNCTNTGWGSTSPDTYDPPPTLQRVKVPIVPREVCSQYYGDAITEHMICAGTLGKGPCSGDSGGPLMCSGSLAGIVSWGMIPCTAEGFPGVFASVALARSWLLGQ